MVEIKALQQLEAADILRLNFGYTSSAVYQVSKQETPTRTDIHLEQVALERPYVKRWETDEEELSMLEEAVSKGFSLGAFVGREMIGIAIAEPRHWNRSLWVWEFHISPAHQRKGIGNQLMRALIQKAREARLRILVCETQNTNAPAIAFYRKMGFELDGIDLSYYTNRDLAAGEVAIFMKYKIEPEDYG